MAKKHKKMWIKNVSMNILRIIIFATLALGAIKIGVVSGDALSRHDIDIAKYVNTETFKATLNYSLPLINVVYNSGHISVSISGEIKKMVKGIFNFDLDAPLTILNSQSPMLYSYYYNNYQPKLALGSGEDETGQARIPDSKISRSDNGDLRGDAKTSEEVTFPEVNIPGNTDNTGQEKDEEENDPGERKVITSGKVLVQQPEGTNYKIDIETLLKEPLKIKFDKSGPKALIYHTHTTESYLKNINELNQKGVLSRTDDERYNVIRVGDEFAKYLKQHDIGTIHNGTNHIKNTDTGAYERSYNTVKNIISGNPSIKLLFDVHRDATGDGKKLRSTVKINGKNAAQIMFVVGTNKNLAHPNWKENLKLALKLQKYLEDNYPGITRPVYISKNRYNAQLSTGALIIEVGGNGNTIDESVESMKYLAKAVSEVIK